MRDLYKLNREGFREGMMPKRLTWSGTAIIGLVAVVISPLLF